MQGGCDMRNEKIVKWAGLIVLIALIAALCGCSNTPDQVEDPLTNYGIEEVLPFATVAPEIVATPTPSPTPSWNVDAQSVPQTWKEDGTVGGDGENEDDYQDEPEPTPRPAQQNAYETLSKGDTGSAVTKLQKRLKTLGYYAGSTDGVYGAGTVSAVKTFQSITGYAETGVATANLQKELFASGAPKSTVTPTPAPTAQYETLTKGDPGARVTRLQNRLKTLGFYTGTADGEYGSGTTNAVKRFQKALGIEQTGMATAALQKKIFSSSAPYYEPAPTPRSTPIPEYDDEEDEAEYVRLAQGSSGTRVRLLQARLRTLGYYSGATDGEYGSGTARAVKLFQRALGLNETGTATASLQRRLYASSAPVYEGEYEEEETETYQTLSPGDSGSDVKNLQRRLKKLGYFTGDIGGNYLTKTTDAVKRFQKAIGVNATGVATASLQRKLFSDSAPSYEEEESASPYSELSEGDTGAAVKRLQQRLADLGYYEGKINGTYNAKTVTAVKRFETRYGKKATGVATVALQKKLFSGDAYAYDDYEDPYEPAVTPTPQETYTRLQKGDSGAKVKRLQRRLKELGYFEGSIGGNFQQLTMDAVKRFQQALGVDPTGVASVSFQKKLFADDAPYYGSSASGAQTAYKSLKRGDKGAAVENLQRRLIELGYIQSELDVTLRTFDKATMLAVIDAQVARGYESDGVADTEFLTYLYSDLAWDNVVFSYDSGFSEEEGDAVG